MTEDNQSIDLEVKRPEATDRERSFAYAGFIIFLILVIALIILVFTKSNRPQIGGTINSEAVAAAKNFYNIAMAYFVETGATTTSPDSLLKFEPSPNVIITGGPMTFDGTNVKFITPMIFRHKDSRFSFILKTDGSYEIVKEGWFSKRRIK